MNVTIGKYDSEVAIYAPTQSSSASGAALVTYGLVGTIPCYINDRMNNDQYLQDKRNDVRRITADVRFEDCPEGINTHWQIEIENVRYAVIEAYEATEFGRKCVMRLRGEVKK